mgnify:CR=1 FL=1
MAKNPFSQAGKPQGALGRMFTKRMNKGHGAMTDWALSHVKTAKDARALDIGCGGGATVAKLRLLCPQGFVAGIDYSEDSVEVSREVNEGQPGAPYQIDQASVSSIPYPDQYFNLITAIETVYFWPNLPADFLEVRRVLAAGDQFMVCCEVSEEKGGFWAKVIPGMTLYSVSQLEELLKSAGYAEVENWRGKSGALCLVAQN